MIIRPHPDEESKRFWAELERKLLSIGGNQVPWLGFEPHLQQLVASGQLCEMPVKRHTMALNSCHANAAKLWAKDVKGTRLVTGVDRGQEVAQDRGAEVALR